MKQINLRQNIYIIIMILLIATLIIPFNKGNVDEIDFEDNVLYLEENETKKLPINLQGNEEIIFTYSKKGIITIDNDEINAIDTGYTTLTASVNNKKVSSIEIYVISELNLSSSKNQIKTNETTSITIDNFSNTGVSMNDFNWELSDNDIASLDDNYVLTGLKDGKVTITVTLKSNTNITNSIDIIISTPRKIDFASILVNTALAEEGYVEGNDGYTKYGAWYGLTYDEWCAMFVSWSVNRAGISTNVIPKFASVKAGKAFFEDQGLFEYKNNYTPKKGDIIFFLNGISHTGIVTKVENGRVYTIEGNSASKVAQRNYSLSDSTITGYGLPNYNSLD